MKKLRKRSICFILVSLLYGCIWLQDMHRAPLSDNLSETDSPAEIFIKWNNTYWQMDNTETLFLLSAYADTRLPQHFVRINGMIDSKKLAKPSVTDLLAPYCMLWYDESQFELAQATSIYTETGISKKLPVQYYSYLFTCAFNKFRPSYVSLTYDPITRPTNALQVIYNDISKPEVGNFVVCRPGLYYPNTNVARKLTEWIEIHRVLGVNKFFFYVYEITTGTQLLLDYYKKRGVVDFVHATLPGRKSRYWNENTGLYDKRYTRARDLQEHLLLNDCFYRHMNSFRHVVNTDPDEVIMPKYQATWNGLIASQKEQEDPNHNCSSFCARGVFFLDTFHKQNYPHIPPHLHMMQHTNRSTHILPPDRYLHKCIYNTESVILSFNHEPLVVTPGHKKACYINPTVAIMHHYRRSCWDEHINTSECMKTEERVVNDTNIWRMLPTVQTNVQAVLRTIEEQ